MKRHVSCCSHWVLREEPNVHTEYFTTESYPVQQRPMAWRETLQQHWLRPEMAGSGTPMHGTVLAGRSPQGIELARISSSPQTIERMVDHPDAVWLSLHIAGEATLFEGGHAVPVVPGDIVYSTSAAELGMSFGSDFRQFIVRIPGEPLKARLPAPLTLSAGCLSGRSGIGRVFAGTLGALAESFESLGDDQITSIEQTLSEFVITSLADSGAMRLQGGMSVSHTVLFKRLLRQIDGNLSDPELSLAALAKRERISERLLQKLFEASGQTFSAHLRQKRLEHCRADLANRLYSHLSISDICFRWGFNDAAHFSRAFREQFQMSPRQYRLQSSEASQQTLHRVIHRGWPAGYREGVKHEPSSPEQDQLGISPGTERAAAPCPGQHHHLCANDRTIHWGYFSKSLAPVLTVNSGDLVTIETLTQHAYDDFDRMIKGDSGAESVFLWTREKKNVDRRGAGPSNASIYGRGSGEGFGVHICTGPIHVRDAKPGDVLEVRIVDVLPRLSANAKFEGRVFGSNAAAWWGFHYNELLTEPKPREVITIYEIDCSAGHAHGACAHAAYSYRWTPQRDPNGVLHPTIDYPGIPVDRSSIVENHNVLKNVKIPVRPHFGVIAVAPRETGLVDSIPPAYFGGNIDNWRVGKGATVYLRVGVDGALLSIGDPHASQGDSELCGTAIECSLTGVFQIVLHKSEHLNNEPYADIDYPLVETADEWILHGFSHPDYFAEFGDKACSEIYEKSSIDLAMRDAFRKTRRFLMSCQGLTEDEAISLMSVAVDFGITQVVDGNVGVHAIIRKALFQGTRQGQALHE
ncbi:Transcriptional regulator, AraC family with acetamidase/formamidase activity [Thiomonas sp. X19]|nr:Transcriptional regulator, AraC family with acetamidase/formamidase activity [Thiomonas sp. X19]